VTLPDALASTAAVTAVAATSIAIAGRLGIRRFADRVLASLVLGAAQIVLTVEALSLLGGIGRAPMLVVHAALALTFVRGRPRLAAPWHALRAAWNAADGPLRLMGVVTAAAAVTIATHAALVPIGHDDSVTYHLPRIAIYLQQRSLDAFPTPDLRQTALPANAEILTLWQMAVSGRNAGAPFLQVIAWLGTALGVYRLARHVGAGLRPAAFAGLAFASLPAVVLQTTAAQNDLTTAFFVVCALGFARSGLAERRRADLVVAGAALGLALGTKATAVLATPALVFLVVAESARAGRVLRREIAWLCVCCVTGFLLLGSYFYAQNLRRYGHATGSAAFADLGALPRLDPHATWSNLVRLGLRLSEPAGIAPPGTRPSAWLERTHARWAEVARQRLGVAARQPFDFMKGQDEEHPGLPIDPDITTFGPLFALAGLPVLAFFSLRRRVDPAARALAWGAVAYVVGLAALLRYNAFLGRFLVVMAAIAAPLFSALYRERASRLARLVEAALALTCCGTLAVCVAVAAATPLGRWLGRAPELAVVDRPDRAEAEVAAHLLDRLPSGSVALVPQGIGDLVHPLFDDTFARRVRVVRASDAGAPAIVDASDYVLVWAETQHQFADGDPLPGPWPWFGISDLRPLLALLRAPGSGWHPVLDAPLYPPGGFHLFSRRPLSAPERAALPDVLPASPPLARDRLRPSRFALPVLVDPARPALVVRGEPLPGPALTIEVDGPEGQPLLRAAPGAPFEERVSLASLGSGRAAYVVLTFRSSAPWRDRGLALASR
jgi:hypothetical protein